VRNAVFILDLTCSTISAGDGGVTGASDGVVNDGGSGGGAGVGDSGSGASGVGW